MSSRWRFPVLVVAIGAIAVLFITTADRPLVKWIGSAAVGLVGLAVFFGDILIGIETNTETRDQEFRRRRFGRWQKNARSLDESDRPGPS